MSTWKLNEKSQGDLKVKIEGEVWENAQKKAFDKLAKELEVSGFRKGNVPAKIAEKHLNPQQILLEAVDVVANDALAAGIKEHNLALVARPELGIDAIDEKAVELSFVCTVKPEVTLGEYKGLPYEVAAVEVSDEEIEAEITSMQKRYAEVQDKTEGNVEAGDTVTIDFEGFKDDVAFEGGKAENYELKIGSNSFIPGFEDGLIGMALNEEKELPLTFPEEYQAKDLAGKEVVFKVKLNAIKTEVLPELNDDFAADMSIADVDTMEQLKEYVKKDITAQKTTKAENEATETLLDTLVKNATVEVPDVMVKEEAESMVKDYAAQLQKQGLQLEQFFQMTGQTEDQLKEQMKPDALKRVELRLVLEKVAEVENIEASAEKIEENYKQIAEQYNIDVEQVKSIIPVENLEYDVKLQAALELVKGN